MKVCKKCGAQMDDDKLFCTTCGSKLPVNGNGQDGGNKWLIIIPIIVVAILLILAIIGFGGWFMWNHYHQSRVSLSEYSDPIAEIDELPDEQEEILENPFDGIDEVDDDSYVDSVETSTAIGAFYDEGNDEDEDDFAEETPKASSNEVHDVVEEMPQYPGGNSALMEYLARNVKYPVVAEENGIQGRVVCRFIVERDGSITDVRVVRSVDPSLDKEAMRVIKGMPRWIPGKQNGSPVRVEYTVPVTFKLQ